MTVSPAALLPHKVTNITGVVPLRILTIMFIVIKQNTTFLTRTIIIIHFCSVATNEVIYFSFYAFEKKIKNS